MKKTGKSGSVKVIQKPSGILCSSCGEEIDLFDGPVRMIGKPQQFPFCWKCWRQLYQMIPAKKEIKVLEVSEKEMHIWLEEK